MMIAKSDKEQGRQGLECEPMDLTNRRSTEMSLAALSRPNGLCEAVLFTYGDVHPRYLNVFNMPDGCRLEIDLISDQESGDSITRETGICGADVSIAIEVILGERHVISVQTIRFDSTQDWGVIVAAVDPNLPDAIERAHATYAKWAEAARQALEAAHGLPHKLTREAYEAECAERSVRCWTDEEIQTRWECLRCHRLPTPPKHPPLAYAEHRAALSRLLQLDSEMRAKKMGERRAAATPAKRCRRCGCTDYSRFYNGGPSDLCDDCCEDF